MNIFAKVRNAAVQAPLEPPEHEVPLMGVRPVNVLPKVWRVREVDVEPMITTFGPILRERWPRCEDARLRFWWRAAMGDRATLFCRSERVMGMFYIQQDSLEPLPRLFEKFVRKTKEGGSEDGVEFYSWVRDWATSASITEMFFNFDSNCPMTQSAKGGGVASALQDSLKGWEVKSIPTYLLRFDEAWRG